MLDLQDLRSGEIVQKVIQRHWIIFVFLGLTIFGALFLIVSLYVLLGSHFMTHMIVICFTLAFATGWYIQWLNHELDLFVVTNNRIIGIEQISFLNRTVSEATLQQVQEVNSQTNGLLPNIFNYGTLIIQTAGSKATLRMEFVPDIITQARQVNNIADEYKDNLFKSGGTISSDCTS